MLYQVNHDNKSHPWCGLVAIAAVTGHSTSEVNRVLREVSGRDRIMGVSNKEMLTAMLRLGYKCSKAVLPIRYVGGKPRNPTLAEFSREKRELFAKRPMIVNVTNHYVVLCGRRFVDSGNLDPISILDAPYRRARVVSAFAFEKVGEARIPAAPDRRPANKAMAKAKRLAGDRVKIERDGDMWWVTCPALADDDPHEGSQGCYSQDEVLEAVEDYVKHLDGGYLQEVNPLIAERMAA